MLIQQRVVRDLAIALAVTRQTSLDWNVEHNRDGIELKSPRDLNQRSSMFTLQVSRVSNCQSFQSKPFPDDEVHYFERVSGNALIGWIVKHQRPTFVRRNDLSWREVFGGPGGLATAGRSAEHYE